MERRATIQGKSDFASLDFAHSLNPRFITLKNHNIKVLKMSKFLPIKMPKMALSKAAYSLTISSLVFASSIQANDSNEEAMQEIVVTAKGNQTLADVLPTSHVLSAEDIEASRAKDIPALLDQISGISVRDSGGRGSATSVFLRGTSSSQTIVLIDGVRVGSATLGAATLNAYPIEAIDRVEVVKGPLSGIYGADAVGGVIQLFTKKGGEGLGEARLSVGSDSLTEYGVAFNGGNEKHSFRISAHAEDTDGIDRTSITTGGNEDEDSFEEEAVSLAGKITLNDNTVANLSVLYSDSTADFDNTFGAGVGFKTDTKTLSTALSITSQLNSRLAWSNTLGINSDESVTTSSFPSDITTDRDSFGSELAYQVSKSSVLTAGVDYYEEEIETLSNFPVNDRDNKGIYAQLQAATGAVGFVGSIRYDDNSAYGSDTNVSLAANYDFNSDLRAVVSYGTAFVAPSFNFLYFPFFGNPDLKPEESESYELSILGGSDRFDWRVSAYKTEVENLFSFNPTTFLAANVGEADIKGVEVELNTQISDWNLSANVDILSAEDKESGTELDDRAERTIRLSASKSFGALDLQFDLKSESGRFDNRGTELSSYGLFDITAQYTVNERLSLAANVDNLFDKDYIVNLIGPVDFYNTEGRQAKLSVRYNF